MEQGPGRSIYAFGIDGKQVHRFASVARACRREEEIELLGYQRPEVLRHIGQIREYIDSEGAMVPNAIVLALGHGTRFRAHAPRPPNPGPTDGAEAGVLEIPLPINGEEKVGFVVDGQQRLAAIREANSVAHPVSWTQSFTTRPLHTGRPLSPALG